MNQPNSPIVYEAVNTSVLTRIPQTTQRLLDLGCGSGAFGQHVKQEFACEVIGVTFSNEEALLASQHLDQVLVHDLNDFDPVELGLFDCIICSHVLEHLYEPEKLLGKLRGNMTPQSTLIVALPNILNWKQRLAFARGHFRYTNGGLMDRTHFRFFDWETAFQLVQGNGYEVVQRVAEGHVPIPLFRKRLGPVASAIDSRAVKYLPGLFGDQFIIVARLST